MERFLEIYNELNAENIEIIEQIYTDDIHFIDPAHEIRGLPKLRDYFKNLYANVNDIHFDFIHPMRTQCDGYVQWTMHMSHAKLKKGAGISVSGATFLKFSEDNRVHYHRDYFDLGAMLYQHLPVLGSVVTSINRRLGS